MIGRPRHLLSKMSAVVGTTPMTQSPRLFESHPSTGYNSSSWRQSDRNNQTSPNETGKWNRRGSRKQRGSGSHWSSEQSVAGAGINGRSNRSITYENRMDRRNAPGGKWCTTKSSLGRTKTESFRKSSAIENLILNF